MKQLIFWAIMVLAAPAFAQDKEPAKPEAAKPAAEARKQAAVTPKKPGGQPRRWNEDARHCLERPSNTEIIKCAEEYL
jgi:hypothetical protein